MFRFVLLSALAIAASAQHNGGYHSNPKTAAILTEQRYLSGDGKFGSAYTQEDGTDFKEETDSDGTRHGSYSYIDPSGQKRTVSYTAGKNGFQASGDHLPVAPPAPAQPAPQPQYQPQPNNNYNQGQQRAFNDYGEDDGSYDARYNDPSYSQNSAPAFRAPAPQHNNNNNYQQQQYQPQPQQYQPQPQQQQYQPQPQQYQPTQSPNRFAPPGKLSLNRTPDGFSYSFNKV
jgi:hypothetical protein